MRLFTALELPPAIRDHLDRAINAIRPPLASVASFTRAENLHVTLKFFGELPEPQLPRLLTALQSLAITPMRFTVERFICLPPRGTTRVLAANLAGDVKILGELFNHIESACAPMGIAREHRPYKPHITLARFKSPASRHTPNSLVKMIDPSLLPSPEFVVNGFVLMQSDLKPSGPVYTPLGHFPRSVALGGEESGPHLSPLPSA
jgi:2'-5' RNA ligase